MLRIPCLVFFLVLTNFLALKSYAEPRLLTLKESYTLAKERSENLKIKEQEILFAEAQYQEALSAAFPQLKLYGLQRIRNSAQFGRTSTTTDVSTSGATLRTQSSHPNEMGLNLSQPLFTGFREVLLAEYQQAEVAALRKDLTRNYELLYQDLALLFNQTVYYQQEQSVLKDSQEIINSRIKELRDYMRLGKARESEVLAAESGLASIAVELARSEGLYKSSRELLAFLLGLKSDEFNLQSEEIPDTKQDLNILIERAASRADLKGLEIRLAGSEKALLAAKRERWPTISLDSNYYTYEDPDTNREWEILLRLEIPIFDAGAITSRIEQNQAKQNSLELSLAERKRYIEQEVRKTYFEYEAGLKQVAESQKLINSAQKNYESQKKDYELGVTDNLEVLNAIKSMLEAERQLLDAKAKALVSQANLLTAAGVVQ